VGRGSRRGVVRKMIPPLPGPLLHPMKEREKSLHRPHSEMPPRRHETPTTGCPPSRFMKVSGPFAACSEPNLTLAPVHKILERKLRRVLDFVSRKSGLDGVSPHPIWWGFRRARSSAVHWVSPVLRIVHPGNIIFALSPLPTPPLRSPPTTERARDTGNHLADSWTQGDFRRERTPWQQT
jgi:hypothetical protein